MNFEEKILQQLERMDRKITMLHKMQKEAKVETWVKASVITGLTGWNNEKMRQARLNGHVKYKEQDGKFFYLLESLNHLFIKKYSCGI